MKKKTTKGLFKLCIHWCSWTECFLSVCGTVAKFFVVLLIAYTLLKFFLWKMKIYFLSEINVFMSSYVTRNSFWNCFCFRPMNNAFDVITVILLQAKSLFKPVGWMHTSEILVIEKTNSWLRLLLLFILYDSIYFYTTAEKNDDFILVRFLNHDLPQKIVCIHVYSNYGITVKPKYSNRKQTVELRTYVPMHWATVSKCVYIYICGNCFYTLCSM